jgi:twitching motility protein PilT
VEIEKLLALSVEKNASDLHLSEGLAPGIRIDGELTFLDAPAFTSSVSFPWLTETQQEEFQKKWEIDFALSLKDVGRFRVNMFRQNRGVSIAFRVIPPKVLKLDELGLPAVFKKVTEFPHGLLLVTGPTGSGKSTTLAAMIDYINHTQAKHIITIEDPIEYIHHSEKCLIDQREVNRDTKNFNKALRSALREDPDIILVGEMRDLETVRLALRAAETGHLVLATLHTSSAAKTIERIIDIFPAGGERALVQTMLSESLQGVISQTLLKKTTGGRVATLEVMLCTAAIRNLIRENKVAQLYSAIQTAAGEGMQTLDQHLKKLVGQNIISKEIARRASNSKELFV